jgi:hypothetical protein
MPDFNQPVSFRLGLAFGLSKPSGFSQGIAVGFEAEVGRQIAVTIDFGLPFRVAPGTVLGTVPTVVPETSI